MVAAWELLAAGLGGMPTEVVEGWELIHRNSTLTDLSEQTHHAKDIPSPPYPNKGLHRQHNTTTMPSAFSNPWRQPVLIDPKRLLPESTPLLEPLLASLLAPGMVQDPRQGATGRSRLAAAFPGPAEMLDAGRRAVS
jgi:hypothetical protein